jgi:carbon monoxide dehydrogenase subunit G
MPEISYQTTMAASRPTVWEFVRDINNWAPLTRGYQAHEIVNDRESIWTVKGDVGPISRVTKFKVTITEWVDGERVAFTVNGLNEPINGWGAITIADGDAPASTAIEGNATIEMGGTLGPVVNHLIVPFVEEGADELVTKIVIAVTGDETVKVRRRNPVILALAGVWNLLRAAIKALSGIFSRRSTESSP